MFRRVGLLVRVSFVFSFVPHAPALLVAERLDGIEACGTPRRNDAEENADRRRKPEAEGERRQRQ